MKLSDYAKEVGVAYITAYRWFKSDKIRGYQMDTGTIIITEKDEEREQKIAVYARVSSLIDRCAIGQVLMTIAKDLRPC
jgi:predicted site-specific integrase-resolvase